MNANEGLGRPVLTAYGDGGFRISGQRIEGSILLLPDGYETWDIGAISDMTLDSLAPLIAGAGGFEILLVGCGARIQPLPEAVHDALGEAGINPDFMDTGAACRTYNVLAGEGRLVAAALIAV